MSRILALLGAAALISTMPAVAADKPSVEAFFKNPAVADVEISPNGQQLAMVVRAPNGRNVLAVTSTSSLSELKVVANVAEADVNYVSWVNDQRLYFTIADSKDVGARFAGSGYAVNADGSQLLQLTNGDWAYNQESTGSFVKSKVLPADYDVFSIPKDGSDDIIVAHYTYDNRDYWANSSRLLRLNTKTRQLKDTLSGSQPPDITGWWLDAKAEPRISASYKKGRVVYNLRDFQTGEWSEIGNFSYLGGEGFEPAFFDGDNNLYVSAEVEGGGEALYRYDLKTRKRNSEPFISVKGFDFVGSPIRDMASRKMLGLHYENDASGTVWLDSRFKEYQKQIDQALPETINTISCGNCLSTPFLLVTAQSDRQPARYAIYNVASGKLTIFAKRRPEISTEQMGERDFVYYAARDGMKIPAYVTKPATGKGPFPTVVLVHGGPFMRGSSWEWDGTAQFLASRGYLVIQPEFRGSRGFGLEHFKAGWKQWGLAMQDDLADAAKWAVTQGLADPKHIGIAGASYGGYASLMGLAKNPEIFRCGVSWVGVTDIDMLFSLATSDASDEARKYGSVAMIGDPKTDADKFRANSPTYLADRITQPLLLAYGGVDRRVPLEHGTTFRNAVSKNNKQVEWVVYPEEGHGWRLEKNRFDFWTRVEAFLDKNLKATD